MGKGGKLTSLKSMLKKWRSSSNLLSRTSSGSISSSTRSSSNDEDAGLHPVYVGQSRRRYLISSHLVEHPLFRVLASPGDDTSSLSVGCEVVLFEHLLWMLENADPQPESLEELVEFYAC